MVCTDKCRLAKGDLCRCSCGGDNHGMGIKEEENQENEEIGGEIIFRYEDPQKSILEFQEVESNDEEQIKEMVRRTGGGYY